MPIGVAPLVRRHIMRCFRRGVAHVGTALILLACADAQPNRDAAAQSLSDPRVDSVRTDVMSIAPNSSIHWSFQVDTPVDVDPASQFRPKYPEQLRSAGIEGKVQVTFIVDTLGRVEMESVRIRSSLHRYFTESVMAALPQTHSLPAIMKGGKVRQFVEQPLTFSLNR